MFNINTDLLLSLSSSIASLSSVDSFVSGADCAPIAFRPMFSLGLDSDRIGNLQ